MDERGARIWIVRWSFIITGVEVCFFFLAPALGYPLSYAEAFRLLQIFLPVFLAYLVSGARFVFRSGESVRISTTHGGLDLLPWMVKAPVALLAFGSLAALVAFGWVNRRDATGDVSFGIEQLAWALSCLLGILTALTSFIVSELFTTR